MSFEPRSKMIWSSGDGSLREMEEEMEGRRSGGRVGGTNKHGDFSSSFFRTPVRLDQHHRHRRRFLPPSGFLMPPPIADRPISSGSKKPLRPPVVRVRPSRRVSAALISGRVCPRYDGKRWKEEGQRGSIILQLNLPNLLTRKLSYLSVWELRAAAAAAGGWRRANRYDLNVSAASNSWLTSLACLLVVAAAVAVLRRVVPF